MLKFQVNYTKYIKTISSIFIKIIIAPLIIVVLFNIPDIFFSLFNKYYLFLPTKREFELLFVPALLISFLNYRQKVITFSIIFFLIFAELSYFNYFGKLITPYDILLFFVHALEVKKALGEQYYLLFLPLLVSIISFIFAIYVIRAIDKHKLTFNFKYCGTLFLVALLITPFAIYKKVNIQQLNSIKKYPQILNTSIRNMYNSASYFFVVTLSREVGKTGKNKKIVQFDNPKIINKNPQQNVILIIGESLRVQSSSLFGYEFDTMPKLSKMQNEKTIIVKQAISAGTMTKVSIAYLLNQIQTLEDIPKIYNENFCLFKLAKENNFKTIFSTMQSLKDTNFIRSFMCPKYIDDFKTSKDFLNTSDVYATYEDKYLADILKSSNLTTPTFMVLQMIGSHTPYGNKAPKKFKKFESTYDNSVYYTDFTLQKVFKYMASTKNTSILPTDVFFVSDHGELLGERGMNGHGPIESEVYKVPFIYFSNYENNNTTKLIGQHDITTHFDISQFIAKQLGYSHNLNASANRTVLIMGKDIDGYGKYKYINITNKGVSKSFFKNKTTQ